VIFHELKSVGYQLIKAAKTINPVEWLLGHRRSSEPRDIILNSPPSSTVKSYWFSILTKIDPHKKAIAKARFIGVNNLVLSLKNIEHAAITLTKNIVETDSLLQIMVNGCYKELSAPLPDVVYVSYVSNSCVISRNNPVSLQKRKLYSSGSWQNFFDGEPVIIVKGSSGTDVINKKFDEFANQIKNWSFIGRKSSAVNFQIKKDSEITNDDLLKYNLILLGGPNQNSFVNKIKKELVTPLDNNYISVGKTNLSLAARGVWLSQYNPRSEKKLIWIMASPEAEFYNAGLTWVSDWNYPAQIPPDLLVVNYKNTPAYEKAVLFDKDWKITPKYLNNKTIGNVSVSNVKVNSILKASGSQFVWLPPENQLDLSKLNSYEAANIIFKNSEFIVCDIYPLGLKEISAKFPGSVFSFSKDQLKPDSVYSIAVMPRDLRSLADAAKGNLGNARYVNFDLRKSAREIINNP